MEYPFKKKKNHKTRINGFNVKSPIRFNGRSPVSFN